jgi:serine/threonine protein phosphatase PrpC
MKYYILTDRGSRDHMEDTFLASKVQGGNHAFAVFDGHGGKEVSAYCKDHFGGHLDRALLGHGQDGVMSLVAALNSVDSSARKDLPRGTTAGTTACIVLVQPDKVVTANIGDSRAILVHVDPSQHLESTSAESRVKQLSRDHKPSDPSEQDRIMRSGGFVTPPQFSDGVHRVMGRLSLSRALGDWDMRPWVSPEPEMTLHARHGRESFALIATDGIWDVLTSTEVAAMVQGYLEEGKHPGAALRHVLAEARRRGSGDNVTLVLVDLNGVTPRAGSKGRLL